MVLNKPFKLRQLVAGESIARYKFHHDVDSHVNFLELDRIDWVKKRALRGEILLYLNLENIYKRTDIDKKDMRIHM